MEHKYFSSCCFCASGNVEVVDYLNYSGGSISRNAGYILPTALATMFSRASSGFARHYYPVKVNKRFFSRKAVYCKNCQTGYVSPQFSEQELDEYYRDFYWSNRGGHEAGQDSVGSVPSSSSTNLSRERVNWIRGHGAELSSAIDFGAGDCAGAFVLRADLGIERISIVDKSARSREIASAMGLPYFASLDAAPPADLVFSAHSIEHVHDLNSSFGMIVSKVIPGGYIFFDTPNIEDVETFKGMPHTPHTYMLSLKSFAQLASAFSCEIVGADTVGPAWRRAYPRIKSDAKTDLRVLLRKKTGDSH